MIPQIVGFVTRAEAELPKPRSISFKIDPGAGGAAAHWGGPPPRIATHLDCIQTWNGWCLFHRNTKGWADIAYTGGYCNHGYAFAGRGHGVRTAAQGTNDGNQRFHAYVWIGGEGQTPSSEALDALAWWVAEGVRVGNAGDEVREHSWFHPTGCPGSVLIRVAKALDAVPPGTVPTMTDLEKAIAMLPTLTLGATHEGGAGHPVRFLRGALMAAGYSDVTTVNANFGPTLEGIVKRFQQDNGLPADGVVGAKTWDALVPG